MFYLNMTTSNPILRQFLNAFPNSPLTINPNCFKNSKNLNLMILTNFKPSIPPINSETNLPPPIVNVVSKYLRQVLGTSVGVAIHPICCKIE